eukprot:1065779-Lingulodinium_polyedra.AAC.1
MERNWLKSKSNCCWFAGILPPMGCKMFTNCGPVTPTARSSIVESMLKFGKSAPIDLASCLAMSKR